MKFLIVEPSPLPILIPLGANIRRQQTTQKKSTNLKGGEIQEDHKRNWKMISERVEQAKGPKR